MPPIRQAVSLAEKKAIRDYYNQSAHRIPQKEVTEWFRKTYNKDLSQSTISEILSPKYSYLDDGSVRLGDIKKIRAPKFPLLDNAVYEWLQQREVEGLPISGDMIKQAATRFWSKIPAYASLPLPDFSNGWLDKFRRRHYIQQSVVNQALESIKFEVFREYPVHIQEFIRPYAQKDIFCVGGTSLFWKLTPNKQNLDYQEIQGMKRGKAKVSLIMCCNADGSERLPLWIVGYAQNPRSFEQCGIFPKSMNFEWKWNGRASISPIIMEEWLRWFDTRMQGRKVLLMLESNDTYQFGVESVRRFKGGFQNTSVFRIPEKTLDIKSPFEQGIVDTFKANYRRYWLQYSLNQINILRDPLKAVNVLKAIRWMLWSWNFGVSEKTIQASFLRSGLLGPHSEAEGQGMESYQKAIMEIGNLISSKGSEAVKQINEYIRPSEEDETKLHQDAVDTVAAEFLEERRFESDEEEDVEPQISNVEAAMAFEVLIKYFEQHENGDPSFVLDLYRRQRVIAPNNLIA